MKKTFSDIASKRNLLLLLLGTIATFTILICLRTPRQDRNWVEDISKLSYATWKDDHQFTLHTIRDWSYSDTAVLGKDYFDCTYNLEALEAVWLYVQPIAMEGAVAHTFLVFEFAGNRPENYLGISIETRREIDEPYSPIAGLFRNFELTYTWATERDLVIRRVVKLNYPLQRYKVKAPNISMQKLLRKLLITTNSLAKKPEWYNTLLDNCTNELLESVNDVYSNTIPLHYSFFLTGYVDDYLDKLGYIDREEPMLRITGDWFAGNALEPETTRYISHDSSLQNRKP